jgi:uncharacterized protein YjbI with pentapeptide repeats
MNGQDRTQASTKRHKSRLTSEQDGTTQSPAQQRPHNVDKDEWENHWATVQPKEWFEEWSYWRTEPEIDTKRQKYLAERRSITPNLEQGIYPFKDIKLNRADVEWLLATHESGGICGPVDWNDESQRERQGLDLRGADLCQADLHDLPLARLHGGLRRGKWSQITPEHRIAAELHLTGANLSSARLEEAYLSRAHLENASLYKTHLERADLYRAHLEGAYLNRANLSGASLRYAFFDSASHFSEIIFMSKEFGSVSLADVHWSDMNLSAVNWAQVKTLGDEYEAHQSKKWDGRVKTKEQWPHSYQIAVRANRQLAIALQSQGLNEEAVRFAYRAQELERVVLRLQRNFGQYLFLVFLDLLTGYGYKPERSFVAYLIVITAFATAYFIIGHMVGPALSPLGSFVFSMTSFHGRGFFPGGIGLDDPLTVLAALEAFVGLLIEVTFIATLTQRLFGK